MGSFNDRWLGNIQSILGSAIGEIVYNAGCCCLIYLAFLFFSKNYRFPFTYILIVVISLIFIPLDSWLVQFAMPDEPIWDTETAKEFFKF
ncbi:DUF2569 family protein (plasmid) [Pseudoalteromonas espejiana]